MEQQANQTLDHVEDNMRLDLRCPYISLFFQLLPLERLLARLACQLLDLGLHGLAVALLGCRSRGLPLGTLL